jgi:hypothetical protein
MQGPNETRLREKFRHVQPGHSDWGAKRHGAGECVFYGDGKTVNVSGWHPTFEAACAEVLAKAAPPAKKEK